MTSQTECRGPRPGPRCLALSFVPHDLRLAWLQLPRNERLDLSHPLTARARAVVLLSRVCARIALNPTAQIGVDNELADRVEPGPIGFRGKKSCDAVDDAGVVNRCVRVHACDAARGVFPKLVVALAAVKSIVRQRGKADVEALPGEAREEPIVVAHEWQVSHARVTGQRLERWPPNRELGLRKRVEDLQQRIAQHAPDPVLLAASRVND